MKRVISRRRFVKIMGAAGAAAVIPWRFDFKHGWQAGAAFAAVNSPGLRMWQTTLRGVGGPTGIPVAASDGFRYWKNGQVYSVDPGGAVVATHYTIGIRQFTDNLHPSLGPTTLWGFGQGAAANFRHLGGLVVASRATPVQITFQNQLTSDGTPTGTPLNSIIPVDVTVLGANQAQNRTAVHLHGGLVPWISDGGPFDWWAPNGTHGSSFLNNQVLRNFAPGDPLAGAAALNEAEYYYPNDQSSRLVWYHDHAWGITRTNAYAGIATGYVIVDDFETSFLQPNGVPAVGSPQYLPIVIQDKIFIGANFLDPTWPAGLPSGVGSLWYAHTYDPKIFKLKGNRRGAGAIPDPSAVPEFFGDTMLANGTVYPEVTVEARRYRLQFLNACNARFLNLQLYVDNGTPDGITLNPVTLAPTNAKGPDFLMIGTEGGMLAQATLIPSNVPFNPITLQGSLIQGNAERADVIVDFSGYANTKIILYNDAPGPFPGGAPIFDYFPGNPLNPIQPVPGFGPNTRNILRFNVVPATSADPPLNIGPGTDLTAGNDPLLVNPVTGALNPGVVVARTRTLTLNEAFDQYGRLLQLIGTNVPLKNAGGGFGRAYIDPATEVVNNGDVEVWKIVNLSADTHPIHFHLVNVQIISRQPVKVTNFNGIPKYIGPPRPADPDERGWKETVRMHPGEEITVIMKFQLPAVPFTVPSSPRANAPGTDIGDPGLGPITVPAGQAAHEYVWHCHILEHEEHDMMRPLVVIG
jgi:spore coat protein A